MVLWSVMNENRYYVQCRRLIQIYTRHLPTETDKILEKHFN